MTKTKPKKKKPVTIASAAYAKLVKFATGGGNPKNTGTIIGSLDEDTISGYLAHMKETDPALFKKWGVKYKPQVEDDDDIDPTADMDDDDIDPTAGIDDDDTPAPAPAPAPAKKGKKESTAGLEDLFGKDEPATTPTPAPLLNTTVEEDRMTIGGKSYPLNFRLRGSNGLDTPLEVFSKNPKWGVIVRVPVPSDKRKVTLSGVGYTVDLLELKRDPDGMTQLGAKKYSNSRLIIVAELEDD